jgi:type VI secretion system protein ImpF
VAELTTHDRLQPALLDRLRDDDRETQVESRDKRVLSLRQLREYVIRDLGWLLNSLALECIEDIEDYDMVKGSVINYGVPNLAGKAADDMEAVSLERKLKEALLRFEPRLLQNSLQVKVRVNRESMGRNAMQLEIEGQLWAQPVPQSLFIKTEVDLETGDVSIEHS